MNKFDCHDELAKRRTMKLWNDFLWYSSGGEFASTLGGAASAAVGSGLGGLLTISTIDSTLNREAYVATTMSLFAYSANFPFMGEAYLQYAEANTNKANIAFGFMSGVGAASMLDNTGEPKTSFSGAVIYKVPGGTNWKTCSSIGTTQTVSQSDTLAGGSAFVRLQIVVEPISSTIAEVTYYVDGVQLKVANSRTPIKDQVTYTGAVAMQEFVCVKNGSTTPEILTVDYIAAEALRARFT
jgi:hypothetical protein